MLNAWSAGKCRRSSNRRRRGYHDDDGGPEQTSSVEWSTTGTKFSAKSTCGAPGAFDFGYDATATTLRLGLTFGTTSSVLTFTKK